MRHNTLTNVALMPLLMASANAGLNILQGSDDGWAEMGLRTFHDELMKNGHNALISAPADNQSGAGLKDAEPTHRHEPCRYNSCPAESGSYGSNLTNPRHRWVNSYPVTGIRWGIDKFGPSIWLDAKTPDLVVVGVNTGQNVHKDLEPSGTVNAAYWATQNRSIPAIAFSSGVRTLLPWDVDPMPLHGPFNARAATKLVNHLAQAAEVAARAGGDHRILPEETWLNVNIPTYRDGCSDVEHILWVLTSVERDFVSEGAPKKANETLKLMERLPTEKWVWGLNRCFATVSIAGMGRMPAPQERQDEVVTRLGSMLEIFTGEGSQTESFR